MHGGLRDEVESRRLAQIERRLTELGSLTKGNQSFAADRLADVLEQLDELRSELKTVVERVDRMAEFLNQLKRKTACDE